MDEADGDSEVRSKGTILMVRKRGSSKQKTKNAQSSPAGITEGGLCSHQIRPSKLVNARTVLAGQGYATPRQGAPLPAALRSGEEGLLRRAAPAERQSSASSGSMGITRNQSARASRWSAPKRAQISGKEDCT